MQSDGNITITKMDEILRTCAEKLTSHES